MATATIERNIEAKTEYRIVLASPSPARLEFLQQLGVELEVMPGILEDVVGERNAEGLVQTRAVMQASTTRIVCNAKYGSNPTNRIRRFIIGLDTVIIHDGELITRPGSRAEAKKILMKLSDQTHSVMTGIAIIDPDNKVSCSVQTTEVTFRKIEEAEIDFYLHSNEAMYHVGGYSLQGVGSIFVKGLSGCYANALGIPLPFICAILRGRGLPVLGMDHN